MESDRRIRDMNTKSTVSERKRKTLTQIGFEAQRKAKNTGEEDQSTHSEDSSEVAVKREKRPKKMVMLKDGYQYEYSVSSDEKGWGPTVKPLLYGEKGYQLDKDQGETWDRSQKQKEERVRREKEREKQERKASRDSRRTYSRRSTGDGETSRQNTGDGEIERKTSEGERKHFLYPVQEEQRTDNQQPQTALQWVNILAGQETVKAYAAAESSYTQGLVSSPPRIESFDPDEPQTRDSVNALKRSIKQIKNNYGNADAPQAKFFQTLEDHLSLIDDEHSALKDYENSIKWLRDKSSEYKNGELDVYNNNHSGQFQVQLDSVFNRLQGIGLLGTSAFDNSPQVSSDASMFQPRLPLSIDSSTNPLYTSETRAESSRETRQQEGDAHLELLTDDEIRHLRRLDFDPAKQRELEEAFDPILATMPQRDSGSDSGSDNNKKGKIELGKLEMWKGMAKSILEKFKQKLEKLEEIKQKLKKRYEKLEDKKAVVLVDVEIASTLNTTKSEEREEYNKLSENYRKMKNHFNDAEPGSVPNKIYDTFEHYEQARQRLRDDYESHNEYRRIHNEDLERKDKALREFKIEEYNYKLPPNIVPLPTFQEALDDQLWRGYTSRKKYRDTRDVLLALEYERNERQR